MAYQVFKLRKAGEVAYGCIVRYSTEKHKYKHNLLYGKFQKLFNRSILFTFKVSINLLRGVH